MVDQQTAPLIPPEPTLDALTLIRAALDAVDAAINTLGRANSAPLGADSKYLALIHDEIYQTSLLAMQCAAGIEGVYRVVDAHRYLAASRTPSNTIAWMTRELLPDPFDTQQVATVPLPVQNPVEQPVPAVASDGEATATPIPD